LIDRGLEWLSKNQNEDGGFGDTDRSPSNLSTTALVLAAWKISVKTNQKESSAGLGDYFERARCYFEKAGGWSTLERRYGRDKTFVVPILANCALAGMVPWERVPQLPFPAACLPQSWYRWAQLPVVSYAIPALVAIGQLRFHYCPSQLWPVRQLYRSAIEPSLRVLQRIQPESGGFLEACPLTSFVLMSLAAMDRADHPVATLAYRFLKQTVLPDGSWQIDVNLATWLTSLTVRAVCELPPGMVEQVVSPATIRWLLNCQHSVRHPFTGADPFGWGWTDLSGGVPDADDTPAAMLALVGWRGVSSQGDFDGTVDAIGKGIGWLLGLQNRDGGWPTFCRGWGKLPFDRSGADLTGHALRALYFCRNLAPNSWLKRIDRAMKRGWSYLEREQRSDGSWAPLWFGNHHQTNDENLVYGTSRVLIAFGECGNLCRQLERGSCFLIDRQNQDGGWGGGSSVTLRRKRSGKSSTFRGSFIESTVEETSLALEGLLSGGLPANDPTIIRGYEWLHNELTAAQQPNAGLLAASVRSSSEGSGNCYENQGTLELEPWPIGLYFAKLWYYERLYPPIFAVSALAKLRRAALTEQQSKDNQRTPDARDFSL
jgi:squalene-hopene/tetraprenyl-beta-curcumene cyclase